MYDEEAKKILQDNIDIILGDRKDEELRKYLLEKGKKAYVYYEQYGMDEMLKMLKVKVPEMISEYDRMHEAYLTQKYDTNNRFGISVSFELIDLINIMKECTTSEEFENKKTQYIVSLGNLPVLDGIREATFEEIQNVYKNIITNVDCITPEVEGKMTATINNNVSLFDENGNINDKLFNFSYLEKVINFAKEHNLEVRLHTLVWHKHFPDVLRNQPKEVVMDFLKVYFNKLNNLGGDDFSFYTVDAINEIVSDGREGTEQDLRDSEWSKLFGSDYYVDVLRLARESFGPNTKLAYNEYDEQIPEKRARIIRVINEIKRRQKDGERLLDVFGMQAHYNQYTEDKDIKGAFADLSTTGLELQVSELDVSYPHEENDLQMNRVFRTVFDCASSYNLDLVNMWGVSKNISWKRGRCQTFLDEKGNINKNSEKLVNAFSRKRIVQRKNMEMENEKGKTLSYSQGQE